jgi:endo-1,4-beta-D-glucanase Y
MKAFVWIAICAGGLFLVGCSNDSPPGSGGPGSGGASAGSGGSGGSGGADASAGAGGTDAGPGPDVAADAPPAAMPHPFGSHSFKYPDGMLKPTGAQATLDQTVKTFYDAWSKKYLSAKCGGYVVLTEGGTGAAMGTFSVSEGHGYGMVITALMAGHDPNAQAKFDGLYAVFRLYPSTNDPNLMAWQLVSSCPAGQQCTMPAPGCFRINGGDSGSATDGDLDIAFALLLANAQWGSGGPINYQAEAAKVIAAIKNKEFNAMTKYPVIADDIGPGSDFYFLTRPSDFMVDHFRSYGAATGDVFWTETVDAIHTLIGNLQKTYSATTGLLPDFVVETGTTPKPAPPNLPADEGVTTAEYAYNSCRVPWRLGTDYVASGDMRVKAELTKIDTWIRTAAAGDPKKIVDGYKLDGTKSTQASGPDLSFEAPFGVSAMVGTDQKWLDALWADITKMGLTVYFGDSIKMLSLIVMSGNWWAP